MRATRRAVTLGLLLVYCLFRSLLSRLTGPDTPQRRAQWNHSSAKLVLSALGVRLKITGNPPARGLLVSNHLSYLEVLVYGAALPCFLVSKAEIARWPFFGPLARAGGTLFIDRGSRESAISVSEEIAARFKGNVPVLFFPEGTSTDGTLLRFNSRLFIPAVEAGVPVTAAAVRYAPEDGSPERDLCWFGDAEFLPHLLKSLGGPNFSAEVRFGEPRIYTDRRTAAIATFAEVRAMRSAGAPIEHEDAPIPAIVE
ncbi:MAG: lysophospholipid acyltransferase family protein [Terracidiphilus sp.]|jgi:1-acyl-sn-glycerol-3-phosphate acyltransferase